MLSPELAHGRRIHVLLQHQIEAQFTAMLKQQQQIHVDVAHATVAQTAIAVQKLVQHGAIDQKLDQKQKRKTCSNVHSAGMLAIHCLAAQPVEDSAVAAVAASFALGSAMIATAAESYLQLLDRCVLLSQWSLHCSQ